MTTFLEHNKLLRENYGGKQMYNNARKVNKHRGTEFTNRTSAKVRVALFLTLMILTAVFAASSLVSMNATESPSAEQQQHE